MKDSNAPVQTGLARSQRWSTWWAPGLLGLSWLALLAVGWAAGSLLTETHPGFDGTVVAELRGAPHSPLTGFMRVVTWLGSPLVLNIVFFAALLGLLLTRSWHYAVFLILASPGAVLMVQIIKAAVDRARPTGVHLTHASGPSWPSGHASSSSALYGALLLIALDMRTLSGHRARWAVGILLAVVLAGIGFSRVYLGVHYPTDVLGAWLLVFAWLTVLRWTFRRARRGQGGEERPVQ
jgi:undecaprenyl-diphosphatase